MYVFSSKNILIKSFLACLCISSATLSGCLSQPQYYGEEESSDDADVDPDLKHEDASFFSKSGAVACGTGAVVGALTCLLVDSNHRGACMALAATAGCAVGMGSNYLLDKVRSDYATTEEQLDATAAQVQKDLNTTRKLHELSASTLKKDKAEIKKLKSDYQKGKADKESLERKDAELAANIKYLEKEKEEADNRLAQAQQTRSAVVKDAGGVDALVASDKKKLRELDEDIAALKAEIAAVNDNILAYSEQRSSLKG